MRLSDWPGQAPVKDVMASKVLAVVTPVLTAMGAAPDPSCWVAWGDDPAVRYSVLAPTAAGLLEVHVRVNVPQEGPRASGKLVRWNRVQVGELAIEMASGHRLLSFQVDSHVLRGTDEGADAIAGFALELFAAIDGRPAPEPAAASPAASSRSVPPVIAAPPPRESSR